MEKSLPNRIALNSFIQYSRLIINLVVSLFSVRIILNALGANDYGIYDVIAGVIGLLGFINSSLNQTSIRYLSVCLGNNDNSKVRSTFNNCFWLHLFIALIISILLEIIGTFIFDYFLNIPPSRLYAANLVYHCMVLTLFIQVAITPFSALIISHEKFIYIAIVSIIDSLLKLAIAFFILKTSYDRLILYGILMALVTIINAILYISYIYKKYNDEVVIAKPSKKGILSQSGFAGWTILDVIGSVATRQGYSIILNRYFGPVINASFAIARQVEGQLFNISASIIDTMKPQIMISFGANDKKRMYRLSITAGKLGFSMMAIVAIPLLIYMPDILTIWLKNVPEGTVLFTRLLVLACMAEQLTRGVVYACQATGKIKWFSVIVSAIRFSALPISLLLFHLGFPHYASIVVFLICESIGSLTRVLIMSKLDDFDVSFFIKNVLFRILPSFFIGVIMCGLLKRWFNNTMPFFILNVTICCFLFSTIVYFFALSSDERLTINRIVLSIFKQKKE